MNRDWGRDFQPPLVLRKIWRSLDDGDLWLHHARYCSLVWSNDGCDSKCWNLFKLGFDWYWGWNWSISQHTPAGWFKVYSFHRSNSALLPFRAAASQLLYPGTASSRGRSLSKAPRLAMAFLSGSTWRRRSGPFFGLGFIFVYWLVIFGLFFLASFLVYFCLGLCFIHFQTKGGGHLVHPWMWQT